MCATATSLDYQGPARFVCILSFIIAIIIIIIAIAIIIIAIIIIIVVVSRSVQDIFQHRGNRLYMSVFAPFRF